MAIYYAASTRGFYDTDFSELAPPSDAVKITKAYHEELIFGQGGNKVIEPDASGYPVLVDKTVSPEDTNVYREKLRRLAYEAEADPLFFRYQRGDGTREEWLAKIEEIKLRYPYV